METIYSSARCVQKTLQFVFLCNQRDDCVNSDIVHSSKHTGPSLLSKSIVFYLKVMIQFDFSKSADGYAIVRIVNMNMMVIYAIATAIYIFKF